MKTQKIPPQKIRVKWPSKSLGFFERETRYYSLWYPTRSAGGLSAAASLVNSVLRCSWYLVTRCLSEIRAVHERRGGSTVRFWRSHAAARGTPLRSAPCRAAPRRTSWLRRYIMPACARRRCGANDLDSIRFDSTRLARIQRSRRLAHG